MITENYVTRNCNQAAAFDQDAAVFAFDVINAQSDPPRLVPMVQCGRSDAAVRCRSKRLLKLWSAPKLTIFGIDMGHFCIILLGLAGVCDPGRKWANSMSSDRLLRAARAAGFAMACDDVNSAAASTPAAATQQAQAPQRVNLPAVVPSASQRSAQGWSVGGWGFWKTA